MASSQPTTKGASLLKKKKHASLLDRQLSASVVAKPTAMTLLLTELLDGGKKKSRKPPKDANRKTTTKMAAPKPNAPHASLCWATALSRQQNVRPPVDAFGYVLRNDGTSGHVGPLARCSNSNDKRSTTAVPTVRSSSLHRLKTTSTSELSSVRKPCTVGTGTSSGVQLIRKRKDILELDEAVHTAYKKNRTMLKSVPILKAKSDRLASMMSSSASAVRNNLERQTMMTAETSEGAPAEKILKDQLTKRQQKVEEPGISNSHDRRTLAVTIAEESEKDSLVANAKESENATGEALSTIASTQHFSLLQFQPKKNRLGSKHSLIAQRQASIMNDTESVTALGSHDRENFENDHDLVLPMPQSEDMDPDSLKTVEVSESKCMPSSLAAMPTLSGASFNNPGWKPIPRLALNGDDTNRNDPVAKGPRKNSKGSDNFVRLNLRNKAGSCRNSRNRSSKSTRRWQERQAQWKELNASNNNSSKTNKLFSMPDSVPISAGVDPVDDFVDGVFACTSRKKASCRGKTIPVCTGHQQPCKLLTVKKTGPNKGRKFYACSFSRSEQCNHFQWVDDTLQAAQEVLLRNQSQSGFVARQVASYMGQIRDLTVPELRDLARRHHLDPKGKKAQLLMRLSIWVRDEVAASCGAVDDNTNDDDTEGKVQSLESCEPERTEDEESSFDNSSEDEDDSASSSDEELEVIGSKTRLEHQVDPCKKSNTCYGASPRIERTVQSDLDDSSEDEAGELKIGSESPIAVVPKRAKVESPIHMTLRQLFGHSNFRDGQEWAIERCLNRQRSLLVAPTGFGKSLCFTLPAAMMDGICIVVSPLLSLIHDQIRLLPARLPAVTLSGAMSRATMAATLDDIVRGRIKILFVSPERLTSSSFRRLFRQRWNPEARKYERLFPQVSLFCVDEAHCLSQWAHNFRPSYLRLRSMTDMIQPQSILAITATAGPRVVSDICRTLHIADGSSPQDQVDDGGEGAIKSKGVRISKTDRDNIDVCCLLLDTQEQRIGKLLKILSKKTKTKKQSDESDPLDGCLATGSVIVYVWRQRDAEIVAENIQAGGISGGVVVYHGGMDAATRAKAQGRFMRGKVRICVATIAFGLGINKADVEGVVHLYLSSSPEHYLQEIGRAGRDGRPAKAVALVLREEVFIRHSLAHTNLISKSQVKALLSYLHRQVKHSVASLPPDRSSAQPVNISLPLAMSILGCDCKTETAETIVSLLEERGDDEPLLFVEGISYDSATIAPKRCKLNQLAEKEPVAKAILNCAQCVEPPAGEGMQTETDGLGIHSSSHNRRESKVRGQTYGSYSFSIAQAANCLGESAEPRHVFAALRRLETRGDIEFVVDTEPKDRSLSIRLTNAGMDLFKAGNQIMVDTIVDTTVDRFSASISSCATKVLDFNYILQTTSAVDPIAMDRNNSKKSLRLVRFQELIASYFKAEGCGNTLISEPCHLPPFSCEFTIRELSMDCQAVLAHLVDLQRTSDDGTTRLVILGDSTVVDYTALTIAKFLHGIAPASFPVTLLRRHHLFGKMQRIQFTALLESVTSLFDPKC